MSAARVFCGCALVLLAMCCVQQVRCMHLRKRLTPHSAETQLAHSNRQDTEDIDEFDRYRRFNRLHTCGTDLDCVGRNRASCCAVLPASSIRLCQPLGKMGNVCNTYSRPHMWSGERLGMHCPCDSGLECLADSGSSFVSRGVCM